jgi:hypothetical protein
MYAAKLGFTLAPEVCEFMRAVCRSLEDVAMVESGLRQFCPPMYLMDAQRVIRDTVDGE